MPRREPTEELIAALERARRGGLDIPTACRAVGINSYTYYVWKARADSGENGFYREFGRRVLGTNKRRHGVPAVARPDWREADRFREWSSELVLDSGDRWVIEDWQLAPVADFLSDRYQAVWLVVPESNGKTTLTAAVVLYLLEHQLTPELPIGSATVTQAETLFRQIEGFIVRSGKLPGFNVVPGMRRIDCRATRGHARVYPHNERSGDGVIPSGWVLDEGHLHPDMRLYRIWKGKYRKRRGTGLAISTAGDPEGEFEELRTKLLNEATEVSHDGPHTRAVNRGTVIHDWAVRDRSQIRDMDVVARANPLSLITAAQLQEKYDEPEMTEAHWLRRTCNIAAREAGQAIVAEAWDRLRGELKLDARNPRYGFVDMGFEIDNTGIGVLEWQSRERRVVLDPLAIEPPVTQDQIVTGILNRQERYAPLGWVYDPNAGGRQMAQLLEQGEHPLQRLRGIGPLRFIEHSQDNGPMSLAAQRMDEAIRNGWLVHDGNLDLRRHALNTVKKALGAERWRYDRPAGAQGEKRRKFPIDLFTGLLFGHSVAVAENDNAKPDAVFFL